MKDIYIKGTGLTKFGESWNKDLRDLAFEAGIKAIKDAKIDLKRSSNDTSTVRSGEIDAIYVANMNAGTFAGQEHLGALISNIFNLDVPAFHIEAACASGGVAINQAYLALQSGTYKNVLVLGVEKMTDQDAASVSKGLTSAADEEWEAHYGVTFPSLYAMITQEHMRKYKTTKKDLALIACKNHQNATLNPNAQFQKEITIDNVLNASPVAEPLGLLDCSPVTDGAAAIILSSNKKSEVRLIASEVSTSTLALHNRKDITTLDAAVKASKKAYKFANINSSDIDIAEVHDCFTIAEILAYEDLDFCKKGEGTKLIRKGLTNLNGKLPVNTSGGLKACGHPVGATGIKQVIEIATQLSGKGGIRQVKKNLKYGLTHNIGGSGATAVVNILTK